jgi:hypothetical protein
MGSSCGSSVGEFFLAISFMSGSDSASMALASAMPVLILRYSRNFSTVGSRSRCFLGDGLELLLVVDEPGSESCGRVFVTGFHLVEAVKHGHEESVLCATLDRG